MVSAEQTADNFFEKDLKRFLTLRSASAPTDVLRSQVIGIDDRIRDAAHKLADVIQGLPSEDERAPFARQINYLCELHGGIPEPIGKVTGAVLKRYSEPRVGSEPKPEPIRWLKTQRDFVYFILQLSEKGFIDKKAYWKKASEHFCKMDGSHFKPSTLATEAERMKKERSWPRGAGAIDQIFDDIGDPRPDEG